MEVQKKLVIHCKFYRELLCIAIVSLIVSVSGIGNLPDFLESNILEVSVHIFVGFVPLYYVLKTRIVALNGKLLISEIFHTEKIEIESISDVRVRAYQWNQRALEITRESTKRPFLIKLSHFETNASNKVTDYILKSNSKLRLHEVAAR